MKKMFLATCLLTASVFAATQAAAPAAQPAAAPAAQPAAAPAAQPAAAPAAQPAAAPAAQPAAAPAAQPAAAPAAQPAAAPATQPAAAPAAQPAAAPATQSAAAPVAEAAPAASDSANAAAPVAEVAPVAAVDSAAAPAQESPKAEEVKSDTAAGVQIASIDQKPAKKKRKKKKMIEKPVIVMQKLAFDINADFELEAEKAFWSSEDDTMNDNFETWSGEANFAVLAESENFNGKIALAFYPGDLKDDDTYANKRAKRDSLRAGTASTASDYFSLDEAWAMQHTDYVMFKVGRWDNTDKNGDYFGGYIDGYLAGFMSTQPSENQLMLGFTPTDNLDFNVSLISKSSNLNKGDVRAAFNFHGLESISELNIQLAYRSNLFDVVYDSDAEVKHNASLKVNLPIVKNVFNIFAETALLNISTDDDMIVPVTGGFALNTPVVDRIIVEAEYVSDRNEHKDFHGEYSPKYAKDVLGAIYIEKSFTDRFSLSAGFHNFGASKDFMLSGNLVGRIN